VRLANVAPLRLCDSRHAQQLFLGQMRVLDAALFIVECNRQGRRITQFERRQDFFQRVDLAGLRVIRSIDDRLWRGKASLGGRLSAHRGVARPLGVAGADLSRAVLKTKKEVTDISPRPVRVWVLCRQFAARGRFTFNDLSPRTTLQVRVAAKRSDIRACRKIDEYTTP
jgi:hypothetical protein